MELNLPEEKQDIEKTISIEDMPESDVSDVPDEPDTPQESVKRPLYFSKKIVALCISVLVLLILLCSLFLRNDQGGKNPSSNLSGSSFSMVYQVSSAIGDQHHIKFKLIVPYSSPEEKQYFLEKLKKINHELIVTGSHPKIERAIEENNYAVLEKHILGIAHNLIMLSTENLAIKDLFLDQP